jgi:methionine synthase I (cobalamin-dependent)
MKTKVHDLLMKTPVIIDGAWGTELQARGLPIGSCPELWNRDNPDAVRAVARSYVEAGSQIILTNTFGGNRFILERSGLADRTIELVNLGAQHSRAAAGNTALVFGSIGPSGRMLITEDVTPEELAKGFAEAAQALKDGGVDALVVETMSDIEEARIAVHAALATGLPVVLSMVYDSGGDSARTMMGSSPEDVVRELGNMNLLAIGANCGRGAEGFHMITRALRACTDLPLWIKPNAGMPRMVDGQAVYDASPEMFADQADRLVEEGAAFIGGCCGTSPDFIRNVRSRCAPE